MGDTNGDGRISTDDARKILRLSIRLERIDEQRAVYCDLNLDSAITPADARTALRMAVSLEKPYRHTFSATVTKQATCTQNGSCNYVCTLCGVTAQETVLQFNHAWQESAFPNPPTCKNCKISDTAYTVTKTQMVNHYLNKVDEAKISANMTAVSDNIGPRWYTYNANKAAYDYILKTLKSYGYTDSQIKTDAFYIDGVTQRNIYLTVPASVDNADIFCLCGHYDSAQSGRGAIDNASGICTLLEAARVLKSVDLPSKTEVRICFFSGEEVGYYGAYRYCNSLSDSAYNRHKYVLNIDMSCRPSASGNWYLCISTEPVASTYKYRTAQHNPTSRALVAAKTYVGDCTETDFLYPVTAGQHDLMAFRKNGLTGATLSWREKSSYEYTCDYGLIAPSIIHTSKDNTGNISYQSLYKTTELVVACLASVLTDNMTLPHLVKTK